MDDNALNNMVVVLADDLTGAADTGIQFSRPDKPAYLIGAMELEDISFDTSPAVLSINTRSRSLAGNTAARIVGKTAAKLGALKPGLIYKKVDSCLRGNVGKEIDAVLEALAVKACFLAPAFPDQGRTTVHGIQYLHGVPVATTEMAHDPVTPISDSNIIRYLSTKSRYKAGRIDIDDYVHGTEFVKEKIRLLLNQGVRYVIFDAVEHYQLDMVAELGLSSFAGSIFAGSAGLAASVAGSINKSTFSFKSNSVPFPPKNNMLWLYGSASRGVTQQIEKLVSNTTCAHIVMDAQLLAGGMTKDQLLKTAGDAAKLLQKGSLVINLSPQPDKIFDYKPDLVLEGLASFIVELMRLQKPGCLFLSGGDTADAILYKTGVQYMSLDQELIAGIVKCRCFGGLLDKLPVISKAGSFGSPDVLLQIWQKISSTEVQI